MSLSPFEISRAVANNLSGAFREGREEDLIEQILQEAQNAKNQEDIDIQLAKVIKKVSPEKQKSLLPVLERKQTRLGKKAEEEAARATAAQAGYTYGAPAGVQTQEVRDKAKAARLQQFGFGGDQPQPGGQFQPGQQSIQQPGQPFQPGQQIQPPFLPGRQPQQMQQPQPGQQPQQPLSIGAWLNQRSDEELEGYSGSPDKEVSEPSKQILKTRRATASRPKAGDEFAKIREKSVSDYVNKSLTNRDEAESMKFTLDTARKAINGEITGPGSQAILKNNPYGQLFLGLTKDEASLQAANKLLLSGSKGIFGAKPTEREIFLLLNSMLPSIGKTREANLAGLDFIEQLNEMKLLHAELVDELTEGGTKYVPDIEKQVAEKMKPIATAFKNDLVKASEKFQEPQENKPTNGKTSKFKAPDGSTWNMTQAQVDAAKAKGVIFEPAK